MIPIPGKQEALDKLQGTVRCGGVLVAAGDVVVADEEGIVVVPAARLEAVLQAAQARAAKDAALTLDEWQADHRAHAEKVLRKKGVTG